MPEPAHAPESSTAERSVVRELIAFASRTPLSAAGAIVGLLIVTIALGANWVAPLDPLKTNFRRMNHEPDAQSLFGTDQVGRDTLSRVIHGARTSLFVAFAAVLLGIAMWQPGMGPSFRYYITSIAGIFFWQRVLFGLAGPALLSYMTWETAKIRSTQSATGILYVDFFTVVVGEVLAKYLLLATRVPV